VNVILRHIEALGGLDVATDEALEVDRVTLGRGTDQHVQLPDMRVTLAHAEIRLQPGGGYRIECQSENPVWVNGSPVTSAALGTDDVVDCGRFRLTIGKAPEGTDLLLQVEERASAREEQGRRRQRYRLTLEQAGLGKRRWAWALALLVLVPLFALPLVLRFATAGAAGASVDTVWQPGPPSDAHSPFVRDCDVCHQTPFVQVRNDACLACHSAQPHHSARPEVRALPGIQDARCGDCHQEHSGREALVARSTELCTSCHAEPDRLYAVAALPPVHGFSDDHPGFTPTLPAWKGAQLERIEASQEGAPPIESSNLRFPHESHLVAEGLSSPEGLRVLDCADCHRPVGAAFAPIRQEEHCGSCHVLDFDPQQPARRLPHRAPREVAALIRGHYARVALAGDVREPEAPAVVRLLRRPGQALTVEESRAALDWADARAAQVLQDVFERRVCATCHVVTATDDADEPWTVEPVALTQQFLTGARFDHAAHRTEQCESCHEARSSKASSDVLIPAIGNCRACHGDPGDSELMGTACIDCHGFHVAGRMDVAHPKAPSPPPAPAP
jgi:predicted CXXCH cytochrome family protein